MVEEAIGKAIESGKAVHFSPTWAGCRSSSGLCRVVSILDL